MAHGAGLQLLMAWAVLWSVSRCCCGQATGERKSAGNKNCTPYRGQKLAKYEQSIDRWLKDRSGPDIDLLRERIAEKPTALWLDGKDVGQRALEARKTADSQGAIYHLVAYNIPNRDDGQYSAGGASDEAEYSKWIDALASGLEGGKGIVVLEPDAVPQADGLHENHKQERFKMLKNAVARLKDVGANVYIDVGHSRWLPAKEAAKRLKKAGVREADGFSINVSNAMGTIESAEYGNKIVQLLGNNTGFIIDVGRNGAGPAYTLGSPADESSWCNPPSLRVGQNPNLAPSEYGCHVDALLWIKPPGESDGTCNGGPPAGQFWPEGAKRLAQYESVI